MTDTEVERALGYTPCICGVIDGTWHDECYRIKRTKVQMKAAYKAAFENARAHLKSKAEVAAQVAIVRAAASIGADGGSER